MFVVDNVAYVLLVIFATAAAICSLLTLAIIYKMGKWNSYVLLITCLTVSQFVYDLSIFVVPCTECIVYVIAFFRCFSGISTTLWTNVISYIVYYIVKSTKSLNIMFFFPYISAIILLYSFLLSLFIAHSYKTGDRVGLAASSDVYYYTRIVSIVINVVLYLLLSYVLWRRSQNRLGLEHKDPVRELANRMKY